MRIQFRLVIYSEIIDVNPVNSKLQCIHCIHHHQRIAAVAFAGKWPAIQPEDEEVCQEITEAVVIALTPRPGARSRLNLRYPLFAGSGVNADLEKVFQMASG